MFSQVTDAQVSLRCQLRGVMEIQLYAFACADAIFRVQLSKPSNWGTPIEVSSDTDTTTGWHWPFKSEEASVPVTGHLTPRWA